MRVRLAALAGFALTTCTLAGCGSGAVPTQLTLYSLDGEYRGVDPAPKAGEEFHGYPVLGKVEVGDAAKRAEVMVAFRDGQSYGGPMMKCFTPRHGLRVVEGERTTDYVICFECRQFRAYDGGPGGTKPMGGGPAELLNRLLVEGGAPLAPAAGGR